MAHYIKMLANIISKRLEEHCSDDDIVTSSSREEKSRMVDWELFLEDLKRVEDNTHKRSMLEQPIERTVQVKKDKDKENHRLYQIEDTILQKALRRSPPPNVLKELEMISPTYRISKQIYDLINAMTMGDDEWTEIKRILYRLTVSKIYGLTDAETKNVFRIRHGWREDTLLMISARRDPPLKVVRELLKGCRESIAIVDTALYDWIPLIYAIAYGAKPDVTKAMIPLKEDFDSLAPLQEHNFLEEVDVYNRTPLHWTVFYDAPLATIIALKEKTPSRALDTEDDLDMRPFELAISEGAAMGIVEALLPDSIPDFETVEMNIIRSFIYKKTKPSRRRTQKEGADEFEDHNVRAINKALEKEDEFADMKRYDASPKCIPYLAKQLAEKKSLQNLLIAKSCHTIPTFIMMLDFYACIMLLWSFRESSMHYLSGEEPSVSSLTWVHVLLFTASFMSFRELCQMCIGGMDWFLNLWNYFDVSTCILTIWCGLKMLANDTGSNFPTLVIWTTAFVWANALFFMRKTFLRFAIFVSGLISIIHDLIPFLVVSLLLLVAFGELYMVDSITNGECVNQGMGNGTSPFCTFQDGLFWTYALFVSGIEIQDFASTTAMRIISIAFGFFVTVILLNVIIAIVSNSWDSVNEQGKEVFWNYRLLFAQDVKNYEELLPWYGGEEVQWVKRITGSIDGYLERIFLFLWPRTDYWGNFDSIIDRVCSTNYGSLSWQFRYDSKQERNPVKKSILIAKVVLLVAIATVSLSIWFIVGLATCGILWPPSMRRFIFASTVISDKTEMEELKEDVKEVLKLTRDEKESLKTWSNKDNLKGVEVSHDNSDLLSLATGSLKSVLGNNTF